MGSWFSTPTPPPSPPPPHPWRQFPLWTSETDQAIRSYIRENFPESGPRVNILLCGKPASGKSSTINTMLSSWIEDIRPFAHSAASQGYVTSKIRTYLVRGTSLHLIDVPGLHEDTDILTRVYKKLWLQNLRGNDARVHGVILVLASDLQPWNFFRHIVDSADRTDVRVCVALTRIDCLASTSQREPSDTFYNEEVKTTVNDIHELLGVNEMNIFPIQNYTANQRCLEIELLALTLLKEAAKLGDTARLLTA